MVQCDYTKGLHTIQFMGPLFSTYLSMEWGVKSLALHYKWNINTSKDNMESLVAWSQMLELLTEISIEKRFYNCYIIDHTNIRFLWWWKCFGLYFRSNIFAPNRTRVHKVALGCKSLSGPLIRLFMSLSSVC